MYYVLEIQDNMDGTESHLVHTANSKNEALSAYYYVLYAAAVSSVPIHTAICVDAKGQLLARESFTHSSPNLDTI